MLSLKKLYRGMHDTAKFESAVSKTSLSPRSLMRQNSSYTLSMTFIRNPKVGEIESVRKNICSGLFIGETKKESKNLMKHSLYWTLENFNLVNKFEFQLKKISKSQILSILLQISGWNLLHKNLEGK